MILALSILSAIVLLLVVAVALQWRARERGMNVVTGFLQERIRSLDAERETLLCRIQLWEGPVKNQTAGKPRPPDSQPGDGSAAEPSPEDHDEEMVRRHLRPNSDGGYLDEYGNLFWTFEAQDEWIAYRDGNGLPKDAQARDHMRGPKTR